MRKSNQLLFIGFLLVCTGWAKEKINSRPNIEVFLKGLKEIALPFSSTFLSNGRKVSNDYFFYEKGNDYFELEDLKCFGYFKREENVYLLYSFNLIGLGEGAAIDMVILSSFNKMGKHIQDIELQGSFGGEGGAYVYKKAIVSKESIILDLTDEHYESDTGPAGSVIEYKRYVYHFDKKYNLIEKTFRCGKLKDIEEYYLTLKKAHETKNGAIYGLSYLLRNYMYCFPVKDSNITTYKRIWNFLKRHVDKETVSPLLTEIKKNETVTNLFMVSVNNLRLRKEYGLKGAKVELLPMNSEVVYLEEKSKYQQEVIINNRKIIDYWYKVKSGKGNVGWLHGCCVNQL